MGGYLVCESEPVHRNIRIVNHTFKEEAGISAHHTAGLRIIGNTSDKGKIPLKLAPTCIYPVIRDNE